MDVNIISYDPGTGLQFEWDDAYWLRIVVDVHGGVVVHANADGLNSFARVLLTLGQAGVPEGSHVHLDEYNGLEPGSAAVKIVRHGQSNTTQHPAAVPLETCATPTATVSV